PDLVAYLLQVDHDHDGRAHAAGDHERLADPELVGDESEGDDGDDVEAPVPVAQGVAVVDREAEDGGEEYEGETDGGVVDEQEERDAEGGEDHVHLEQLAPRVAQRSRDVNALGPGLDQRPV